MKHKMNILYITNMYPNSEDPTYGIFVKEQIDAISQCEPINYMVYSINGKRGLLEYVKSVVKIRRLIAKEHFDLIHIHYGLSGLFLLLGKIKVPVLMTLHGGDIQAEQGKHVQVALTKKILKRCDFAITLNERMDNIVKHFILQTEIVPCSVNTKLFKDTRNNESKNVIRILFPSSRNRIVKDFPLFQKVCEVLRLQYLLDVEEHYMENLTRQQVSMLFNQMDVLLMTSISEGSPQVVKEAMACNLPVVSTNVGDVKILLDGVKNSYVADSRDASELAALVYKSLSEEKDGLSPRDKISFLKLDDDSIAQKILSIYYNLINGNGKRA